MMNYFLCLFQHFHHSFMVLVFKFLLNFQCILQSLLFFLSAMPTNVELIGLSLIWNLKIQFQHAWLFIRFRLVINAMQKKQLIIYRIVIDVWMCRTVWYFISARRNILTERLLCPRASWIQRGFKILVLFMKY